MRAKFPGSDTAIQFANMTKSPIRPTDDDARKLARTLIDNAEFGAIGVLVDGAPMVSRISIATHPDGTPLTLISDLSLHTKALRENPSASLLLGEPGERGDPLTHPRITLQVQAEFLEKSEALAKTYLAQHPKAKLYIGFADFNFVRLRPTHAHLNGGFGKAFNLSAADLTE